MQLTTTDEGKGAVNQRGKWQGLVMERGLSEFQEDDVMGGGQVPAAGGRRLSTSPMAACSH